jgi:hypothetical protein
MLTQLFDLFGIDYDTIQSEQKEIARKQLDDFINGIA